MKVSLIVTAAGSSRRFWNSAGRKAIRAVGAGPRARPGTGQPRGVAPTKLFANLGDRPILQHTLEAFQGIPEIREILVTLPAGTDKWVRTHLLGRGRFSKRSVPVRLVRGGATRAESVWNALQKTSPKSEWILVHDGARPFPPKEAIRKLLRCVGAPTDGILLARPVVPTLKRVSPPHPTLSPFVLETIDRNGLVEAETPQLVRRSVLIEAYRKNPDAFQATDESSLVEAAGGKMQVLSHTGWNVKVTTPEDLKLAEAYYASHSPTFTVGFGRDTHRLVEGRKLYLGGVRVPSQKGALGHSDGDALLHAVADAILGAVAAGDIGEWFSDRNPRYKNLRSEKILRTVLEEARRQGWTPGQVDTVILLEKPKLDGRGGSRTAPTYKMRIRKRLAQLLALDVDRVSVKAKTAEGLGPEGEGRAVTCEALVTLWGTISGSARFKGQKSRTRHSRKWYRVL